MELTERCQNNCVHCAINRPADDTEAARRELSTAEWKTILSEATALGCLDVRWTGGEPLLRDDFEELYLFARRLGLRVTLFTNAALVSERLADLLAQTPPLSPLEITIYGMTPKTCDAVTRTSGSFDAARQGLERLLIRRIPVALRCVAMRPTANELAAFEEWAAPHSRCPPWIIYLLDLRSRRDDESRNELIRRLRLAPDEVVKLLNRRPGYRKEMQTFCRQFVGVQGDRLFPCGAGCGGCIDAYGNYQVCLPLRHPETIYPLRNGSLAKAVTEFAPTVTNRRAANPAFLARCARCFLRGLCEQCPAKSWFEHGTLDTPVEYFCEVAHAQARDLGLLTAGERSWDIADPAARLARMGDAT